MTILSIKNQWHPLSHKNPSILGVAFAMTLFGFSLTAQAGKITSVPSAAEAPNAPEFVAEGFGGWNLDNVKIIVNGTQGEINSLELSWFDESNGAYNFGPDSDFTYTGNVNDGAAAGVNMGIVLAKDWPVGEPSGIKIVNDDTAVKFPKPQNCIMATSYLVDHFLDSTDPQQVPCSGPFQSHKRYKLAMLPTTVDGTGSESVDLVFNVEADLTREYQVFQKINNWTDGRLEGFTIQVGFGVGSAFQTATDAETLEDLHLTVPSDIWAPTQLANFSEGLFGPFDDHTESIGFFDPMKRAGFLIDEYGTGVQPLTDTLTATTTLGSDYAEIPPGSGEDNQFGPWLPNSMLPYGIFFDDDGNPETDAELLAWYGWNPTLSALGWMGGSQDSDGPFSAIPDEEIILMGQNLSYTMDVIDDLVNVGLNYIVTVGDVTKFPTTASGTFTIRITPTADTSGIPAPSYVGEDPDPLLLFTSSDAEVLLEPEDEFIIGSLLTARVGDADLNQDPLKAEEVVIDIFSDSGLGETLTLTELGENRGVFAATLPEEYSNVAIGTQVTISYLDEDTGEEISETKTSSTTAIAELEPILSDVTISGFDAPENLFDGLSRNLKLSIINDKNALEAATGSVLVTGSDGSEFTGEFTALRPGGKQKLSFRWTASLADPAIAETVSWIATVTVNDQIVDDASAATLVEVKKGKNSRR